MTTKQITNGVIHEVPQDLYQVLISDESALERWEDLTPLARNEWICWCITNKKPETRKDQLEKII
jgi:uncharacterized protein YdeI (YjbR/CyaY-like superfamily)